MNVILCLLSGLSVGSIAYGLAPSRQQGQWRVSLLLGALGSFLGVFLGGFFGLSRQGETGGIAVSMFGAVACVLAYQAIVSHRKVVRLR